MKNKPFSDILPESSDFAIECMHFHKDVSMSSAHFHSHHHSEDEYNGVRLKE